MITPESEDDERSQSYDVCVKVWLSVYNASFISSRGLWSSCLVSFPSLTDFVETDTKGGVMKYCAVVTRAIEQLSAYIDKTAQEADENT